MKQTKTKILALTCGLLFFTFGCASTFTRHPVVTDTGTNWIVAPSATASNFFRGTADAISSIPSAGIPQVETVKDILLGILALGWGITNTIARIKTRNANEAADLLAAQIVASGRSVEALKVASGTKAFSTVAQHIDNNTL